MNCVRWQRLDKLAAICLACEGTGTAAAKTEELERAGYTVSLGYCSRCIDHFHLDSLRGTSWEIPATAGLPWAA